MWKCSVPDSVERLAWGLGSWVKWVEVPVGRLWPEEAWSWQSGGLACGPSSDWLPRCLQFPLPRPHFPYCVPSAPLQMMQNLLLEAAWFRSVNLQVATYSSSGAEPRHFWAILRLRPYPSGPCRVAAGGAVQAVGDSRPPWEVCLPWGRTAERD